MFAIVKEGGKQYRAEVGKLMTLEKILAAKSAEYKFKDVLLYCDGEDIRIGKPLLSDISVIGEVVGDSKGKKLVVQKFRKRESFEKRRGHRQAYTEVRVKRIEAAAGP